MRSSWYIYSQLFSVWFPITQLPGASDEKTNAIVHRLSLLCKVVLGLVGGLHLSDLAECLLHNIGGESFSFSFPLHPHPIVTPNLYLFVSEYDACSHTPYF